MLFLIKYNPKKPKEFYPFKNYRINLFEHDNHILIK